LLATWLARIELTDALLGAFAVLWMFAKSPHADHMIVFKADASGACHADVTIHNHAFHSLLDSGAIGMPLVFGSNNLADLGLPRTLSFTHSYSSANGEGQAGGVILSEVKFGGWVMHDVPAMITKAPQDEPLFGAMLLHRLSFRTVKGFCVLEMPSDDAGIARDSLIPTD
jgi:clan AA aspartic protease (TIGR02281 family)